MNKSDKLVVKKLSRDDLVEEVKDIISRYDTKLTLRQIFYQLVSKHLIPNNTSAYQRLSKVLVWARHEGLISWISIEDRTRVLHGGDSDYDDPKSHFNDAMKYFARSDEYYRLPFWFKQGKYVEVWFEKQALQSLFFSVTDRYNISGLAIRGYSSHTVGYELQRRIERITTERPEIDEYVILYFGDFDPSGEDIYRFIQDMSERFSLTITFEKIAITPEQIEEYNIPPMMAKKSDSRYAKFVEKHGEKSAVELDALDPDVLKGMIKSNIEMYLDSDVFDERKQLQDKHRERIRKMIMEVLGKDLYDKMRKGGDDDE